MCREFWVRTRQQRIPHGAHVVLEWPHLWHGEVVTVIHILTDAHTYTHKHKYTDKHTSKYRYHINTGMNWTWQCNWLIFQFWPEMRTSKVVKKDGVTQAEDFLPLPWENFFGGATMIISQILHDGFVCWRSHAAKTQFYSDLSMLYQVIIGMFNILTNWTSGDMRHIT